jgi:GxxExxY protein
MEVHPELGPGLNEELYQRAMMIVLSDDNILFDRELIIPIVFRMREIGKFKLDFVADGKVLLELKAVASLGPVHRQQVIACLAASGLELGLLLNFGAASLEHHRIFPPRAVQSSVAYQSRRLQVKS